MKKKNVLILMGIAGAMSLYGNNYTVKADDTVDSNKVALGTTISNENGDGTSKENKETATPNTSESETSNTDNGKMKPSVESNTDDSSKVSSDGEPTELTTTGETSTSETTTSDTQGGHTGDVTDDSSNQAKELSIDVETTEESPHSYVVVSKTNDAYNYDDFNKNEFAKFVSKGSLSVYTLNSFKSALDGAKFKDNKNLFLFSDGSVDITGIDSKADYSGYGDYLKIYDISGINKNLDNNADTVNVKISPHSFNGGKSHTGSIEGTVNAALRDLNEQEKDNLDKAIKKVNAEESKYNELSETLKANYDKVKEDGYYDYYKIKGDNVSDNELVVFNLQRVKDKLSALTNYKYDVDDLLKLTNDTINIGIRDFGDHSFSIKYYINSDISSNDLVESIIGYNNDIKKTDINLSESYFRKFNNYFSDASIVLNRGLANSLGVKKGVPYLGFVNFNSDVDTNSEFGRMSDLERINAELQIVARTPLVKYPYVGWDYGYVPHNGKDGVDNIVIPHNHDYIDYHHKGLYNYYFMSDYDSLGSFLNDFYKDDMVDYTKHFDRAVKQFTSLNSHGSSLSISLPNPEQDFSKLSRNNFKLDDLYLNGFRFDSFTKDRLHDLNERLSKDKDDAILFLLSKRDVLKPELYNELVERVKAAKNGVELSNILTRDIYKDYINNSFKDFDMTEDDIRGRYDGGNDYYSKLKSGEITFFDFISLSSGYQGFPMNYFITTYPLKNLPEEEQEKFYKFIGAYIRKDIREGEFAKTYNEYINLVLKAYPKFDRTKFIDYVNQKIDLFRKYNSSYNPLSAIVGTYWFKEYPMSDIEKIAVDDKARLVEDINSKLESVTNITDDTKELINDLVKVFKDKDKAVLYLKDLENRIDKIKEVDSKEELSPDQKATWSKLLVTELDYNNISNEINEFVRAINNIRYVGGEHENDKIKLLNNTYFRNRKGKRGLSSTITRDAVNELPVVSELAMPLSTVGENHDIDIAGSVETTNVVAPPESSNIPTSDKAKPRKKILDDSLTPKGKTNVSFKTISKALSGLTYLHKPNTDGSTSTTDGATSTTNETTSTTDGENTTDVTTSTNTVGVGTDNTGVADASVGTDSVVTANSATQTDDVKNSNTVDVGVGTDNVATADVSTQTDNVKKPDTSDVSTQTDNVKKNSVADKGVQTDSNIIADSSIKKSNTSDVSTQTDTKSKTNKSDNKDKSNKTEYKNIGSNSATKNNVSISNTSSPKTGDPSELGLLASMFAGSGLIGGLTVKLRKRK